ncbi:hypothetical protein BDQ12DRAFT_614474 [Crucibulum laeve]|uniref:N-acetyl-D-glucosamine kinase n=1 Tax=Crucibulum laeve TaxID=68775 RepID=A0A5C3LME2_9AGAR|nr:hypothetical protein BDQ12DRAFT_614474 [Crucibulum laeve]
MTSSSSLGSLQTESRNDNSERIDEVSTIEMCEIINEEDATVAHAVKLCLGEIARTIDLITDRVQRNGRVVYIGAGTSGRLGILDASEIPPTFSAPYTQFVGMMAGGDTAIRRAVEGAEDSTTLPVADLKAISPPLNSMDTLIGIATSGRTPYVLAGLSYARNNLGMLTVGISCVRPSEMQGQCDCLIECVVGAEAVTGSTRMKAGTATKMILNMISTGVMIRVGKTYGNMMVDVKSSNHKLIDRARRIYRTLLPSSTLTDSEVDTLIASCGGSVKLALVVGKLGVSVTDGRSRLETAGGLLKKAWDSGPESSGVDRGFDGEQSVRNLVLCIDAGGTKCSAVIAGKEGILSRAESGPCNFVTLGHEVALAVLSVATARAISLLTSARQPKEFSMCLPTPTPIFAAAWVGGAGLDRVVDLASIKLRISRLLSLPDPSKLLITNDAALLSSAIIIHSDNKLVDKVSTETGVVLITGTGSIAYSFGSPTNQSNCLPIPLERAGGWGYLLGDEGSAYAIGREAIRTALRARDMGLPPTILHTSIMEYFGCSFIGEIISAVYNPSPTLKESQDVTSVHSDPKLRIAGACPVVFNLAFSTLDGHVDNEAISILKEAARSAAHTIGLLLGGGSPVKPENSALILGGALVQVEAYRKLVLEALERLGHRFAHIEAIPDAAGSAVRLLIRHFLLISP